mgnify:CR=1 FL=1
MDQNTILVTGGYGFIGSALCRYLYKYTKCNIIIIDKLTYASNLLSLESIINDKRVIFYQGSIGDRTLVKKILNNHNPHLVFNLAAETHVDNSIKNPSIFVETNVLETHFFLEEILFYYLKDKEINKNFKILHISTDEVYGDIDINDEPVTEAAPYNPSSPYSATKASSDHLVKSYFRTFKLPALISHCSNNFGPFQNSEKFIPVIVSNILNKKKIPVYGDGMQIREWLFVDDHCDALFKIIKKGKIGESFNIGSIQSITNIDLIRKILSAMYKNSLIKSQDYRDYIKFVPDRFGHDRRYAINSDKVKKTCGWEEKTDFDTGIELTIKSLIKNKT